MKSALIAKRTIKELFLLPIGGTPLDSVSRAPFFQIEMTYADQIIVTEATIDDSLDIWRWRNDLRTRNMSLNAARVNWASHCAWFKKSLLDQDRVLLVGRMMDGSKVGICRFDISPDARTAEVSINLNPLMRGKGLSNILLACSIKEFRNSFDGRLEATIKSSNIASIKIFEKNDFSLLRTDESINYYAGIR